MSDRKIWFRPNPDGDGAYRPVTREGRLAFAMMVLWIFVCGGAGMVAFALTWSPWSFVAMFAAGAAGMAVFVRTVRRHR